MAANSLICTLADSSFVALRTHCNYKVTVTMCLSSREVRPVNGVLDNGTGPNLIQKCILRDEWLLTVKSEQRPQLWNETIHKLAMGGTGNLHVSMIEAQI